MRLPGTQSKEIICQKGGGGGRTERESGETKDTKIGLDSISN